MGQRAAKQYPLNFQPGVYTNAADRDARNRWKSSNNVRWHKGLPEKIGGFERIALTGHNNGVYIGVARALHDWSSLDGQQWIAVGTHCKLEIVNNGQLSDITPVRKTSNVTNPLVTAIGTPTVTVNDPDHRAAVGDYVSITATSAVGGLTIAGDYRIITVVNPDRFTITAAGNATSTATGGGGTSLTYDIGCGLSSNGELLGYGTGRFGEGTYGTPRAVGSGVPARLRIWSMGSWGEDLVASPNDGELYFWDRSNGPNTRATRIDEAPTNIQRILVNPEDRVVIAIGCSGLDGIADPMRVRWCDIEDFNTWIPTDENSAGGKRLDYGSRLVTGIRSRDQHLIWSDLQLYAMLFLGPGGTDLFGFRPLGKCSIVGPNAATDANGEAYFMCFDDFFIYDGTLRALPCDVHTQVFGDFDRTQAEKVTCTWYESKNEVRWDYPSLSGNGENDRWVAYNREMKCWYTGSIVRTAYHGISAAITGYMTNPYGANNGYLYKHETGTDEVDGSTTVMAWHLESFDINVEGMSEHIFITGMTPNFDSIAGSILLYFKKKKFPRSPYQVRGPYTIDESTLSLNPRVRGAQIAMRLEAGAAVGQDLRFGVMTIDATGHGFR